MRKEIIVSFVVDGEAYKMIVRRNANNELYRFTAPALKPSVQAFFDLTYKTIIAQNIL
jgi:hypothetical protein